MPILFPDDLDEDFVPAPRSIAEDFGLLREALEDLGLAILDRLSRIFYRD